MQWTRTADIDAWWMTQVFRIRSWYQDRIIRNTGIFAGASRYLSGTRFSYMYCRFCCGETWVVCDCATLIPCDIWRCMSVFWIVRVFLKSPRICVHKRMLFAVRTPVARWEILALDRTCEQRTILSRLPCRDDVTKVLIAISTRVGGVDCAARPSDRWRGWCEKMTTPIWSRSSSLFFPSASHSSTIRDLRPLIMRQRSHKLPLFLSPYTSRSLVDRLTAFVLSTQLWPREYSADIRFSASDPR